MNPINNYPVVVSEVKPPETTIENNRPFLVANTQEVTLEHLKRDCIIPVFSKDNESTISHHQFIEQVWEGLTDAWPGVQVSRPQIRVSHVVKGRIPSAIGKPAKELTAGEKTIYYERCAFLFQISGHTCLIDGNPLNLSIGGVRAYNQENLYSRKTLEKFKIFVGYRNQVCMNLCISTDGFSDEVRVSTPEELCGVTQALLATYDAEEHSQELECLADLELSEQQFAHLIGKLRMYGHLPKEEKRGLPTIEFTDSQLNQVVRDYYGCDYFGRQPDGRISLWNLYNLMTEANKSSYIDRFLDRGVQAYGLMQELAKSVESSRENWFLNKI